MVALMYLSELALEVDFDREVEVAVVPRIWFHREFTKDLLALLYRHVLVKVEDCLLPMRVLGLRSGAETHALVALGEFDVEKGDKSLNVVVPTHLQSKVR